MLLSRIADSLYWMGRYLERSESQCRLLAVHSAANLELGGRPVDASENWRRLLEWSGHGELLQDLGDEALSSEAVCGLLVASREIQFSVFNYIRIARDNGRAAREHLSRETWEGLNRLYWYVRERARVSRTPAPSPHFVLQEIMNRCQMVAGLIDDTLLREDAWWFLSAGKVIERALTTCRYMSGQALAGDGTPWRPGREIDTLQWMTLLKSCTAYEAYRRMYVARIEPDNVMQLLLLKPQFPRSVAYCIKSLNHAVQMLGSPQSEASARLIRLGRLLEARLLYSTVPELLAEAPLDETLTELQSELLAIADAFQESYVSYR